MSQASERPIAFFSIVEPADLESAEFAANWTSICSPADALRTVRASRPRAVLVRVDVEVTGACLAVLEELHRRWPHLPVVVVSARQDEQIERRVRAAGAHCYLHGEIDPHTFAQKQTFTVTRRRALRSRVDPPSRRPTEPRAIGPPLDRVSEHLDERWFT